MRSPWIKWIVGVVAFLLPAVVCFVGSRLDHSGFGHDPRYAALIPVVLLSSVILAAGVPAVFILRSALSRWRRIGLMAAVWCLLALECGLAIYVVLMEGLR
jgi:hypothetical protein